jgi:hypothetical protein
LFFKVAWLPLALGCTSFCVLSTIGIRSYVSSRMGEPCWPFRGVSREGAGQASSFDFRDGGPSMWHQYAYRAQLSVLSGHTVILVRSLPLAGACEGSLRCGDVSRESVGAVVAQSCGAPVRFRCLYGAIRAHNLLESSVTGSL